MPASIPNRTPPEPSYSSQFPAVASWVTAIAVTIERRRVGLPPCRANRVAPQTPFAHPPPAPAHTAPQSPPNDFEPVPGSGIIFRGGFPAHVKARRRHTDHETLRAAPRRSTAQSTRLGN